MNTLGSSESEVLIFLINNAWKNFSEIRGETSLGQYALNNAINTIEKYSLIEERRGDRNAREFKLTEKGEEVAKNLKAAREAMNK